MPARINREKLRELALAAAGRRGKYDEWGKFYEEETEEPELDRAEEWPLPARHTMYIAAAAPAVILALLDELESKDRRIAALRDHIWEAIVADRKALDADDAAAAKEKEKP